MEPLHYIPSYIEALAGLLIFGVSIPSIFIIAEPKLRSIRNQYAFFQAGSILDWFLRIEVIGLVMALSLGILVLYQIPTPSLFCDLNTSKSSYGCTIRNLFVSTAPYWANVILLLNILIIALLPMLFMSYNRERIIKLLGRVCRNQALKNSGQIEGGVLTSLTELGVLCAAGNEKRQVLDALESLWDLQITPKSWAEIATVVTQVTAGGDEQNVEQALAILQDAARFSFQSELGDIQNKPFYVRNILNELESMFIQALGTQSPPVLSQLMNRFDYLAEHAPSDAAMAFLNIGMFALEKRNFEHAVHALDKLHTVITELLEENGGKCPEEELDALYIYLAFLAQFWAGDITTRQHGIKQLDELCRDFNWDEFHLTALIHKAEESMISSNLRAAALLMPMLYGNRQISMVRKAISKVTSLEDQHHKMIPIHFPSIAALKNAHVDQLVACNLSLSQAESILWHARYHVNNV